MALDSAQLMQVLDRYQTRLHQAGNADHDEEFEYVRQIVASPIFHQFLRGEISRDDFGISRASQEVVSAELSTEAIVNELTSSEIQKRRLARRKSLKALRNAVMSSAVTHQPPPVTSAGTRKGHLSSRSSETSSSASSPSKHTHVKSYSGSEGTRNTVHQPDTPRAPHAVVRPPAPSGDRRGHAIVDKAADSPMTNGTDIDTPLEGLVGGREPTVMPISPSRTTGNEAILSPRIRNLSNSTNTLIERLSPPIESPTKGRLMGNGRGLAESHPNVHSLGLHRPEMDTDLFSTPLRMLSPNLVPEWNGNDRYPNESVDHSVSPHVLTAHHPHLHYTPSPTSHHPFVTKSTTPHHRLTTETPRPSPLAPPPYNHLHINTHAQHRRSKSFEDILNSPEFDPLNFHRTPIPQSVVAPQIEMEPPGTPTGSRKRVIRFQLILEKGNEGLGFLVKNREGGEGGLVVQYLSPGGLAERDGRLKPNDIITAINGTLLETTSHSEAVRLLQAVRGAVQLSCVREQELGPLPPSSPSAHTHPSPSSPLTLTAHPHPPTSPSAHSHSPPSPLTHLSSLHSHSAAPITSTQQPPPSPLSLTSHPPPSHNITPTPMTSHPPSTPNSTPTPASHPPNVTPAPASLSTNDMPTSEQPLRQQIKTVHLTPPSPSSGGDGSSAGVGLSLAPHSLGGTMVAAILEHGTAKKDGRLSEGDRLLQVNEEDVRHMTCDDVTTILHSLTEAREMIRVVVAHSERGEESKLQEVIPEVMDSSGDELEQFEVELSKSGHGLGITIAGLVSEDTEEELKGLYITSINTQGAVGRDGRAKVNDRILRVDGKSLRGLENMEAATVLRNSGNPVRLVFGRPRAVVGQTERGGDDVPRRDDVDKHQQHLHSDSQSEAALEEAPESLVSNEDMELVKKWTTVMGPNYEIKIARVVKSGTQGGLGICMESIAELNEEGVPQEGSTRHIITQVKEGPVMAQGVLRGGDEILQVNNIEVLGLEHDQAIEVVKETPAHVMIVVCRQIGPDGEEGEGEGDESDNKDKIQLTESETTCFTAESDDHDGSTPDVLVTTPTREGRGGGGFGGKDVSRRFERQSWRERHAEERRRLKHRFEQRREEYERHIRELEDELVQREKEQREMQLLMADEEEEEGSGGRRGEGDGGRERRRSTLLHPSSSPNRFDYSAYHDSAATTFTYPDYTDREVGSPDTDSSQGVLSPVPGTGFWEPDLARVTLHKGEEGLGFSILDFADPHHEGERIILIQSLVEGGVAEQDGRLRVGDRLVSVNDVSVVNTSLQFAVQQLVAIPQGSMVELSIHHPVLAESDFSDSSSFSPLPTSPSDLVNPHHDNPFLESQFHDLSRNQDPSHARYVGPQRSSSLSGSDDLEHATAESEERVQRGNRSSGEGEGEREGGGGEEGEDGGWKMKKHEDAGEGEGEGKKKLPALESEDDEPPPPYSRTDPQEKKSKQGTVEPPRPPSTGANVKVELYNSETARKGDRQGSLSPLQLSRISSPPRGLSLSELTRVTPEDQERWRQSRESLERERSLESLTEISDRSSLPRNRFGGSLEIHVSHHVRELSRTGPLVQLQAPQQTENDKGRGQPPSSPPQRSPVVSEVAAGYDHPQVESNSDTTLVGSQSQSDTGAVSLQDGGEEEGEKTTGQRLRLQPVGDRRKGRKSPKGARPLKQHAASGPAQSKETAAKASTLAVSYSHSQVTNTSSQDSIQDGLSPDMSDYDHSSELDNDPREIHIPKASSNFGLSLTQDSKTNAILVKSVKGTIRKDGRIRSGDQILAINRETLENISLTKANKMLKKAASKSDGVTITYLPAPQIHGFSSSSNTYSGKSFEKPPTGGSNQQHFPPNQPIPQQNLPGGPSLHNIPEHVGGPAQNVGMAPPTIIQPQMGPPAMSQWTYPLGPGAAISPIQPPPYNYQLPQTTRPAFSQPLQPVMWQVQQPGSLPVPVGQPAPQQVAWILREPPQYADHLVQHHIMSAGAPYPISQTGPVSVPTLPQGAPPVSQPPPTRPPPSQPPPSQSPAALPTQPQSFQLHPPPSVSQQSTPAAPPRSMTKAQSEIKLGLDTSGKPDTERRHKSQSGTSPRHPPHPYTVYRRRQQQQAQAAAAAAAAANRAQQPPPLVEEPSEPKSPPQSRDKSHDHAQRLHNMSHDQTHDEGGSQLQQHLRMSVDREVEEDPELRREFPSVEGVLFEVWLNKGSRGLGMSIVANRDDHAPGPRGIVIMGIQAGGVADRSRRVMWGDMILKINDTCVIGMTQQDVQEMLMRTSPLVRFVMLRQPERKVMERTQPSVDIISGLPQVRVIELQRDNEKGLGFKVVEGAQGGVITISSITPGGPAEKEGTLQPGDQLISIDGQKILGYSFEKARHLLQQARARGWVRLIVTSRGRATVGGEGAGNLKSSVPDSVVLRQKKRNKENSMKSSHRRPVSVDYDAGGAARTTSASRNRDRRTTGGAGEQQQQQGERAERGGGRTETEETAEKGSENRNSHTLTEREVEIGFQKMEKHNVILPGRECRITIFKGSQVLGLTVVGGVDTYLHNIIIERVIPNSPAATDGRLRPGDRLLEINNVSLSEATCEDALAALQHPSPFIHLTVLRTHNQEPTTQEPPPPASPTTLIEKVELVKPPHAGLGLLIQESSNQTGVYVQEVVENQTAFNDGRIKSGDKILAINHTSTVGASQDTVFKLLQTCQGRVVLTVQHHDPLCPVMDFSETESNHHFSQSPAVKYQFGGGKPQPTHIPHRDPPPYPSAYLPDPPGAHPGGMWASPHPAPLHHSGEGMIKYVKLRKGPTGLGFTIVGGAGSSHGDKPIYVNRVLEESAAGRDRRLHKGDQLLAVNGISFEGVTHQFAAETLKQQSRHGDVELTVLSFE